MRAPAVLSDDLMTVYLNDHLAGATFGTALARRTAAANAGSEFGPPLAELAAAIAADRAELVGLMGQLGRDGDRVKVAVAWVAERAARLKPNGRVLRYSPLSRVLELESLAGGVEGKLALWRALRAISGEHDALDEAALDRLIERAEGQQRTLVELHERAAPLALAKR